MAIATATAPTPFIKWAGGKKSLLSQIRPHVPKFKNYYEPFVGGGALFFSMSDAFMPASLFADFPVCKATLMDANKDLINSYKCVKECPGLLIEKLREYQKKHDATLFHATKALYNNSDVYNALEDCDRAALFIYIIKTCFNGVHRRNKKGEFNTSIGTLDPFLICQPQTIYAASQALQQATIIHGDFANVEAMVTSSDDFVYFDPPYHPISKTSSFTNYTENDFKTTEQTKLRDICVAMRSRGVKVMISNSDCAFIRELYADFNLHIVTTIRTINPKRGADKINELLITSY